MPSRIIARCELQSVGPYHQSRRYDNEVPHLDGESPDDYDRRNWRHHLHVRDGSVVIPARAIQQSLVEAAAYNSTRIQGQGSKTWTAKFRSGIAVFDDIDLGIKAKDVDHIEIWADAQGRSGSGKRVLRRLPIIPEWSAAFDVVILDPMITEQLFKDTFDDAGLYIGIGQYRPANGGTAGRFEVIKITWSEALRPVLRRPRALRQAAE